MRVREACVDDFANIASLLARLYEEEAPRMLTGSMEKRRQLLVEMLIDSRPDLLGRCYVIKNGEDLCGYVALAGARNPRRPTVSASLLDSACRLLGVARGTRFVLGILKLANLVCAPLPPDTAQLHSLIVLPAFRGQGLGAALCAHVENEASKDHSRTLVYVLRGNPALSFYIRRGYTQTVLPSHRSPLKRLYRIPGCALVKPLPRDGTQETDRDFIQSRPEAAGTAVTTT